MSQLDLYQQVVYGPPGQRFRLSGRESSGQIAPWLAWRCWALLTAWNPHGERLPDHWNASAQARLLAELRARQLGFLEMVNGEGEWAEDAVMVRDLPLKEALGLGRRFSQAALLWGSGRRVALVGCEPLEVRRLWLTLAE